MSDDIVERLNAAGTYLGHAIAGYRDDNLERAARGMVDVWRTMCDAADEIERLRILLKGEGRNNAK